jgi:hypothetical protein
MRNGLARRVADLSRDSCRQADELAAASGDSAHPLHARFATLQTALLTKLERPPRSLAHLHARLDALAYDPMGNGEAAPVFGLPAARVAAARDLAFHSFATWAAARLRASTNPRRLRVEAYGLPAATL